MITAIIYKTRTGFTREYAELLSEEMNIPVFSVYEAKSHVPKGAEIVYLGWLCGGRVKGAMHSIRRWKVEAIGIVGMGLPNPGEKIEDMIRENFHEIPLFYMRGGLRLDSKGYYANVIKKMRKTVVPYLSKQETLTVSEAALLEVMRDGGDFKEAEYLDDLESFITDYNKK